MAKLVLLALGVCVLSAVQSMDTDAVVPEADIIINPIHESSLSEVHARQELAKLNTAIAPAPVPKPKRTPPQPPKVHSLKTPKQSELLSSSQTSAYIQSLRSHSGVETVNQIRRNEHEFHTQLSARDALSNLNNMIAPKPASKPALKKVVKAAPKPIQKQPQQPRKLSQNQVSAYLAALKGQKIQRLVAQQHANQVHKSASAAIDKLNAISGKKKLEQKQQQVSNDPLALIGSAALKMTHDRNTAEGAATIMVENGLNPTGFLNHKIKQIEQSYNQVVSDTENSITKSGAPAKFDKFLERSAARYVKIAQESDAHKIAALEAAIPNVDVVKVTKPKPVVDNQAKLQKLLGISKYDAKVLLAKASGSMSKAVQEFIANNSH